MWDFKGKKSPCKNCESRYPACHDECDMYRAWKEKHQDEMDEFKRWMKETYYTRFSDNPPLRKGEKR